MTATPFAASPAQGGTEICCASYEKSHLHPIPPRGRMQRTYMCNVAARMFFFVMSGLHHGPSVCAYLHGPPMLGSTAGRPRFCK